ncbi:IclR family transcriptional regulator, partial [Persicitalea sp.]|uniref:IclR family transcriptional regulator n=1 Tax=Persicitalea sp. TaxID=3100273 RepID=UPI0035941776
YNQVVQVIIRGFDILELVAQRNGHAITLTEISEELALNQSTAANIIKTLVHRGYMEHIGKKKGYCLGPAAFRLTNETAYGQDLITASQDIMENLTTQLSESCILGILRNHKRYTLNVVNSKQEIQIQVRSERNVYETASGRLLIAYLSHKDLERFVEVNGLPKEILWPGANTLDSLKAKLEAIRHEGIVFTQLQDRHVKGYAVPVFAKGVMVAGLSVFLPEFRWSSEKEREIVKAITVAAMQISSRLS